MPRAAWDRRRLDFDARAEPDVPLRSIRRNHQLVRIGCVRHERHQQHQRLAVDTRRVTIGERHVADHQTGSRVLTTRVLGF